MKRITCIGAGHVGGPTMAVIAKNCPDYEIMVVDINEARIKAWNSPSLPIFEPGLAEIVEEVRGKNLFFSLDVREGIANADIIFVSVNTPLKEFGRGAGRAPDLQYWEGTAREIVQYSATSKIVVEKSTLPVRTAEAMERILNSNEKGIEFEVLSNPEFLAEGTAIQDMECPDRVLIGGKDTHSGQRAVRQLVDLYSHWVPSNRILTTGLWSSELSKLAANAFLAQRVSSINAISALCERTGADVDEVSQAIGFDRRLGPHFLKAGIGFGGSCFRKDIHMLVYLCEHHGLPEVAQYWEQVIMQNDSQRTRFVETILRAMFDTVARKRIAIFGASFKKDTADIRDSPALLLARDLLDEQAQIVLTDPRALENARAELSDVGSAVEYENDPYRAAAGSHAIVVATDWDQFTHLDYERVFESMCKPAFIFDGRNLLDRQLLKKIGFEVYSVGKPALTNLERRRPAPSADQSDLAIK